MWRAARTAPAAERSHTSNWHCSGAYASTHVATWYGHTLAPQRQCVCAAVQRAAQHTNRQLSCSPALTCSHLSCEVSLTRACSCCFLQLTAAVRRRCASHAPQHAQALRRNAAQASTSARARSALDTPALTADLSVQSDQLALLRAWCPFIKAHLAGAPRCLRPCCTLVHQLPLQTTCVVVLPLPGTCTHYLGIFRCAHTTVRSSVIKLLVKLLQRCSHDCRLPLHCSQRQRRVAATSRGASTAPAGPAAAPAVAGFPERHHCRDRQLQQCQVPLRSGCFVHCGYA